MPRRSSIRREAKPAIVKASPSTPSPTQNSWLRCCCCVSQCWASVGRYWMCTAGWLPLVVALIVTVGCVLSVYSSSGCQFIDLHVGFTPSNAAWNASRAELGLFYFHQTTATETEQEEENNKLIEQTADFLLHDGCVRYTPAFQADVIDTDRTWRVARVMAMIAVGSSLLAALTLWSIVLLPIFVSSSSSLSYVWPGLVLPSTMLSFVAEGSKFLFFDIALCRNSVWFPSGVDSWPEPAQGCQLHHSAVLGIAAAVLHLLALLGVCLCGAPQKRVLNPEFGNNNNHYNGDEPQYIMEQEDEKGNPYFSTETTEPRSSSHYRRSGGETKRYYVDEDPSILDEDMYTEGPSPANSSFIAMQYTNNDDDPSSTSQDDDDDYYGDKDESISAKEDNDREESTNSNRRSTGSPRVVSASRLAAYTKAFASSTSKTSSDDSSQEKMIAELLTDLDQSLTVSLE